MGFEPLNAPSGGGGFEPIDEATGGGFEPLADEPAVGGRGSGFAGVIRDVKRLREGATEIADSFRNIHKGLASVPEQFAAGAVESVGGGLQAVGEITPEKGKPLVLPSGRVVPAQDVLTPDQRAKLAESGKNIADRGAAMRDAARPKDMGFAAEAITDGFVSAAQNIPWLMTGPVGLLGLSVQAGAQSYAEARRQGLEPDAAFGYGYRQMLIEGGTELLPFRFLQRIGKEGARAFLGQVLADVPGENIATFLESVNTTIAKNPNASLEEIRANLPDPKEYASTTIASVTGSALLGGGAMAAKSIDDYANEKITIEEPLADGEGLGFEPISPTQEAQIDTANELARSRRKGADDRASERSAAAANRQRLRAKVDAPPTAEEQEAARAKLGPEDGFVGDLGRVEQLRGEPRRSEDRREPEVISSQPAVLPDGTLAEADSGQGGDRDVKRREGRGRRLDDVPDPEFGELNETPNEPSATEAKPEQTFTVGQSVVVPVLGKDVTGQVVNQKGNRVWVKRADNGKVEEVTANGYAIQPKVEATRGRRYEETFPAAPSEYQAAGENFRPVPNELPSLGKPLTVSVSGQKAAAVIKADNMSRSWTNELDRKITTFGTEGRNSNAAAVHTVKAELDASKLPDGVKITFRPDGVAGAKMADGYEIEHLSQNSIVRVEFPNQPSAEVKKVLRERGFKPGRVFKVWTRKDWYNKPKDTGLRNREGDAPAKPTGIDTEGRPTFAQSPETNFDPKAAKPKGPVTIPDAKKNELSDFDKERLARIDEQNAKPAGKEFSDAGALEEENAKKPKRLVSDDRYQEALNILKGKDLSTLGAGPARYMEALIDVGVGAIERGITKFEDWVRTVLSEYRARQQELGDDYKADLTPEDLAEAWAESHKRTSEKSAEAKRDFDKLSLKDKRRRVRESDIVPGMKNAIAFDEAERLGKLKPGEVYHIGGALFVVVKPDGTVQGVSSKPRTQKYVNDKWNYDLGDRFIRFTGEVLRDGGSMEGAQAIADTKAAPFKGLDGKPVYVDFADDSPKLREQVREGRKPIDKMSEQELSNLFYTHKHGIDNRRAWREKEAKGKIGPVTGLIDLKKFKDLNTLVTPAGADQVLRHVAEKLESAFDNAAAWGGDEFLVDGKNAEDLKQVVNELEQYYKANPIPVTFTKGGVVQSRNVSPEFKVGTGGNFEQANRNLQAEYGGASDLTDEDRPRSVPNNRGTGGGTENVNAGGAQDGQVRTDADGSIQAESPTVVDDGGNAEKSFTVTPERWTDTFLRRLQDKFIPLKRAQKAIAEKFGPIDEALDAYLAEELSHGKTEADLERFEEEHVKPLAEAMAADKVTRDELDLFLYATHAPDRNRRIAAINPSLPDGGSGITNEQAALHLASIPADKKAKLEKLAKRVYSINQARLKLLRDSGLETPEVLDAWENKYGETYVPLKGIGETDRPARSGRGFDIRGAESMRALGRTTLAESPLLHSIAQMEETIVRARKAEVARTFLRLVQAFPNKEYWEVFGDGKWPTRRQFNRRTGEVEFVPDTFMHNNPDYFAVKDESGKQLYIKVQDRKLLNAMQNLGPEQLGTFTKALGVANRYLATVLTSLNPEFVVSNFIRDVQTAVFNTMAAEKVADGVLAGKNLPSRITKDIPHAMRAIYREMRGKGNANETNAQWRKWYQEFREDGGQIGFFGLKTLDTKMKELESLVRRADGSTVSAALNLKDGILRYIGDTNKAVENAVRLSAYANARQAGLSRAKAASLAKNLTVNFNRKGEMGTVANTAFLFFNASVQGSAHFARVMKSNRKVQGLAGAITLGAFLLTELNRAIAGDDDDGESWYDKIPDSVKERNLILMQWWRDDGAYMTLPLPYGYNVFHIVGSTVNDLVHGARKPLDAAAQIALGTIGAFSPIGIQDSADTAKLVAKSATPTLLSPLAQIAMNENFMGSPIYKAASPFGTPKPDSWLTKKTTKAHYAAITQWLNEATGGSAFRSGAVDLSPDVLDYLVGFTLGGTGQFVSRTAGFVEKLAKGEEMPLSEIPFVRRLASEQRDFGDLHDFWDRKRELDQLNDEYQSLRGAERLKFWSANKAKLLLARRVDDFAGRISKLDGAKQETVVDQFNKLYRQTEGKTNEEKNDGPTDRNIAKF